MKDPFVSIITVNWNNCKDTIECVNSLLESSYVNYRIIVVDNNSNDNSFEEISNYYANKKLGCLSVNIENFNLDKVLDNRLMIIKNKNNAGFAGGNNTGIKIALDLKSDYVWLINNDTAIKNDALEQMVKLSKQKDVGIVGSKILSYYNKNIIQSIGGWINFKTYIFGQGYANNVVDDGSYDNVMEPDYINGASMLINKKVFDDIGFFDENYFLYWEETDLCVRAKKNKWKLLYCPKAIIYHKEGGTTQKGSKLTLYYYTRNSLYFYKKNDIKKFGVIFILGYLFKITKRLVKLKFKEIQCVNKAYKDFISKNYGRVEI
jgi:GT2 family glycosyltransferase